VEERAEAEKVPFKEEKKEGEDGDKKDDAS